MTTYTTQMDAARKGIVTPQIKTVAEKEHMPVEKLMELVAEGKVAICANKHHTCLNPEGVGSMLRTKINVNLGVSRDCKDYDIEMQKVMKAVDLGAEAIMDLSSHGNTQPFRQKLTHECPAMIGTVPVYDSVIHYQRDLSELTAHDFIDVIRLHAEDGVDFVTLHCGITRKTIEQIKKHKRKMNIVSRGGSLVFAWPAKKIRFMNTSMRSLISVKNMMLLSHSVMPAVRDVWLMPQMSARSKSLSVWANSPNVHGLTMFRLWLKVRDTFRSIRLLQT